MKKIYLFVLLSVAFFGCSKDIFKSYDKRIVGTWYISDVNRIGIGGGSSSLPFREGSFTFYDNGSLEYVNEANTLYKGSWDIRRRTIDEETVHSLQITAVDFNNQDVLAEYYDEIYFTGTNKIRAVINANFNTYTTHLKR